MFSEKKSYASFFLKKHKVEKQDLMDLVSTETILDEGMAALGGGMGNTSSGDGARSSCLAP